MSEFIRWGAVIWEHVITSRVYSLIFYFLVAAALFGFGLLRRKSSS
jgi:hypothetical protein